MATKEDSPSRRAQHDAAIAAVNARKQERLKKVMNEQREMLTPKLEAKDWENVTVKSSGKQRLKIEVTCKGLLLFEIKVPWRTLKLHHLLGMHQHACTSYTTRTSQKLLIRFRTATTWRSNYDFSRTMLSKVNSSGRISARSKQGKGNWPATVHHTPHPHPLTTHRTKATHPAECLRQAARSLYMHLSIGHLFIRCSYTEPGKVGLLFKNSSWFSKKTLKIRYTHASELPKKIRKSHQETFSPQGPRSLLPSSFLPFPFPRPSLTETVPGMCVFLWECISAFPRIGYCKFVRYLLFYCVCVYLCCSWVVLFGGGV